MSSLPHDKRTLINSYSSSLNKNTFNVLLCCTGSVAAIKIKELVRALQQIAIDLDALDTVRAVFAFLAKKSKNLSVLTKKNKRRNNNNEEEEEGVIIDNVGIRDGDVTVNRKNDDKNTFCHSSLLSLLKGALNDLYIVQKVEEPSNKTTTKRELLLNTTTKKEKRLANIVVQVALTSSAEYFALLKDPRGVAINKDGGATATEKTEPVTKEESLYNYEKTEKVVTNAYSDASSLLNYKHYPETLADQKRFEHLHLPLNVLFDHNSIITNNNDSDDKAIDNNAVKDSNESLMKHNDNATCHAVNISSCGCNSAKKKMAADNTVPVIIMTDSNSEWIWKHLYTDTVTHIDLRKWANLVVVAPLSANSLAKFANGISDNLVMSVLRAWDVGTWGYRGKLLLNSTTYDDGEKKSNSIFFPLYLKVIKPVVIAPAMNPAMWHHPLTFIHLQSMYKMYNCGLKYIAEKNENKLIKKLLEAKNNTNHKSKFFSRHDKEPHQLDYLFYELQLLTLGSPQLFMLPPISKLLACGDTGMGAMADVNEIAHTVQIALCASIIRPIVAEWLIFEEEKVKNVIIELQKRQRRAVVGDSESSFMGRRGNKLINNNNNNNTVATAILDNTEAILSLFIDYFENMGSSCRRVFSNLGVKTTDYNGISDDNDGRHALFSGSKHVLLKTNDDYLLMKKRKRGRPGRNG